MRSFIKSGWLWQFAGGFALGAIGLFTLQPSSATRALTHDIAAATHLSR